jgi:hypothetical protein
MFPMLASSEIIVGLLGPVMVHCAASGLVMTDKTKTDILTLSRFLVMFIFFHALFSPIFHLIPPIIKIVLSKDASVSPSDHIFIGSSCNDGNYGVRTGNRY